MGYVIIGIICFVVGAIFGVGTMAVISVGRLNK